jgi:ubiquinone/menaquinone biosynthesis C-methylase UbiE
MSCKIVNLVTSLHKATHREYIKRMQDDKIGCMKEAKQYSKNYWDGPRRYGYGGYKFIPGRWTGVAKKIIKKYRLDNKSRILDVGCGKAFLLYEIKKILPLIEISGFDISKYGISHAPDLVRKNLFIHRAQDKYPFKKNYFDLTISLGCLHNLEIYDIKKAISEIKRVSKKNYIMTESYRSEKELFNLQCWALTCESFFSKKEWIYLLNELKYKGDLELIYFE